MPFFSVVIPVYNRGGLIAATMQSVLSQQLQDYELIVVDDGSTDNSAEVIKNVADGNAKVKYLWQQNGERGAARNHGFRIASGEYVVFLDSDDLMQPEYLEILYKKITENIFPNFLTTKYFLRRAGKDSVSPSLKSLREGYYDINLQLTGGVFACNFAVKRDNPALFPFIEDKKYSVSEDWMFITQNLAQDKIYLIDEFMVVMNDHDDRSMRRNNKVIIQKHLLATVWIERNILLKPDQKRKLWSHSYNFCAIHSYLDGSRRAAFHYLRKAIRSSSFVASNPVTVGILFVKIIIGYKLISAFKK